MFARERFYVNNDVPMYGILWKETNKFQLRALYLHVKTTLHRDFPKAKHSGQVYPSLIIVLQYTSSIRKIVRGQTR